MRVLAIVPVVVAVFAATPAHAARWERIEAANGRVYAVDVASMENLGRKAGVVVHVEGDAFPSYFLFDCPTETLQVQYGGTLSRPVFVPPRSVAGVIGAATCSVGRH